MEWIIMQIDLVEDEYRTRGAMKKYRRRGGLIARKLAEYIPVMIVTNLSLLLINTVDGVVAGNFVGPKALSSISIFFPIVLLTSAFSSLVASGIGTCISSAMGKSDTESLAHLKSAGVRVMIVVAAIVSVAQIPVVWMLIRSYGLSSEMSDMIWQYAIGCMICTPLGIISTVGTYQLQIAGKMKVLMVFTLIEGLCNLVFDLLFVAVFHMGVAGTGFGTAVANFLRCAATVSYMLKYTDFYKGDGKSVTFSDFKTILTCGAPDAAFVLMNAFQNYFMLRIILNSFGESGGVINGVCAFCLSLVNVLLLGIQGGMRPLMGLFVGADDKQAMNDLIRQGVLIVIAYAGIATLVIFLWPEMFYSLHGVHEIPDGGLLAVRMYTPMFVFRGFNFLLRLYLSNRKDAGFATAVTVLGSATLPVFAYIIASSGAPAPYIFLAYTCTELFLLIISGARYTHWRVTDRKEQTDDLALYMTISKDDASEAAEKVKAFADEKGIDESVSYKTSLCLEEMVAYVQRVELLSTHNVDEIVDSIQKSELAFMIPPDLDLRETVEYMQKEGILDMMQPKPLLTIDEMVEQLKKSDYYSMIPPDVKPEDLIKEMRESDLGSVFAVMDLAVEVIIRFKGKDKALLITLDDGKCIALDKSVNNKDLITDSYDLVRKVANNIEYQYILNMNYSRISIE